MNLKPNMNNIDRMVRIGFATLVGILYVTNVISGTLAIILGVVALILLVTGAVSFCPIYKAINFSTRKEK